MRKWVPTIAVLAVLAALGTYVAFFETKPKETPKIRLYEVKPQDIVKFRLEDLEKAGDLVCEKRGEETWMITSPQSYEAETDTAELVTRNLAEPAADRRLGPQKDLDPFGLTSPSFKATFTDSKGTERVLEVGLKNATGSSYFVRPQGSEDVYTVAAHSIDGIRKGVMDLRSRTLMKLDPAQTDRIVLRRPKKEDVEIRRTGQDAWELAKPIKAPADRFVVDGLLNSLKNFKGQDIMEEPQAYSRYKLDQPVVEISVFGKDKTGKQTLTLTKAGPNRDEEYASSTRLPFVFKVRGTSIIADAAKEADDYREKLLLSLDREDLSEAVIQYRKQDVICRKTDKDKWIQAQPPGGQAEEEMNDMLFEAAYLRVEKFVDDSPVDLSSYGLSPARLKVTLRGSKDGKTFTHSYAVGNASGDYCYLRFGDAPSIYSVRKDVLEKLERFAEKSLGAGKPAAPAKAEAQTP